MVSGPRIDLLLLFAQCALAEAILAFFVLLLINVSVGAGSSQMRRVDRLIAVLLVLAQLLLVEVDVKAVVLAVEDRHAILPRLGVVAALEQVPLKARLRHSVLLVEGANNSGVSVASHRGDNFANSRILICRLGLSHEFEHTEI